MTATEEQPKKHRRTNSQISLKKDAVIDIQQSPQVAIKLDSAYKHYGSGKSRLPVLVGLNMEVQAGQIYGLLGKR